MHSRRPYRENTRVKFEASIYVSLNKAKYTCPIVFHDARDHKQVLLQSLGMRRTRHRSRQPIPSSQLVSRHGFIQHTYVSQSSLSRQSFTTTTIQQHQGMSYSMHVEV